jgi:hypothetical protein
MNSEPNCTLIELCFLFFHVTLNIEFSEDAMSVGVGRETLHTQRETRGLANLQTRINSGEN